MPASQYNFSIDQGTSFGLVLTSKDSNGSIINLTNYCARLSMTTSNGQIYVFTTENTDYANYKFFIEGNLGKISLLIPASTTNSYMFDNARYDFELQSPNDYYVGGGKYTERILYGNIILNKRFSKSPSLLDCNI